MNKKLIRKMLTASGGPLKIKFTPEQIALFESYATRVPGMNNSEEDRYRKEGVQALQYLKQETKRKEKERLSRMEIRPILKRKATIAEKLRGKKDEYELVPLVVGMSGADPLLSFYIAGVGLNGIGALAKTGLWNVAKYAPTTQLGNWGRGYFVGNTFKNSFNGAVPTLTSQATSLLYLPVKLNESGLTSLKFFERPSKISEAERTGISKGSRNNRLHGQTLAPYYDYSLINKHYEPWTVNEKGQFVFESPEKARKLGTLHFTFNKPVMSHTMGSWDDAPTVTLLPYRNVRSLAAPVDIAIMDTFFPNYKGLKISSRGAKTLTGDKKTFDYYKSKGLDVEFSPEMEGLLQQLQGVNAKLELLKNSGHNYFSPEMLELYKQQRTFKDKINSIGVEWSKKHVKPIPSYEKVNALGKAEGFDMEQYPYRLASPKEDAYGIPLKPSDTELNYTWQSDPSNHFMIGEHPEVVLKSALNGEYGKVRPEFIKYLEWASRHKADYRKKGGKMNMLEFLKKGSGIHIKKENKGKFTNYCGGKVTDECIRKAKASGNPTLVKRATFAANARKWKHLLGGIIKSLEGSKVNWGELAVNTGTNLLSTISKNKLTSYNAQAKKALNQIDYDLFVQAAVNNAIQKMNEARDQWRQSYLNGDTLDRSFESDAVMGSLQHQFMAPEIAKGKLTLNNVNALVDAEAKALKGDNWSNMFGNVVQTGLGALGNYLGLKKTTTTSTPLINSQINDFSSGYNLFTKNSVLYNPDKFWNL